MTQALSLDMRAAMAAEATDEVFVALLTFAHPSQPAPLRLSTDRTEVVSWEPWAQGTRSRGDVFYWTPMSLVLPSEGEEITPEIRISADLIDRELLAVLRADPEPASVRLEIVSAERPDVVEIVHDGFEVQSAPYDEAGVSLVIVQPVFAGEPHPADTFNPGAGIVPMSAAPLKPGWSNGYIGVVWSRDDAGRAGTHCWGLVRLVFAGEAGIEIGDYGPAPDRATTAALMARDLARFPWREVARTEIQPLDILVFAQAGLDDHVGVAVDRRLMLHVPLGGLSRLDALDDPRWSRRLAGVYRWAGGAA